jgi:hypothetical protein
MLEKSRNRRLNKNVNMCLSRALNSRLDTHASLRCESETSARDRVCWGSCWDNEQIIPLNVNNLAADLNDQTRYRGLKGTLISLEEATFSCTVRLDEGKTTGSRVSGRCSQPLPHLLQSKWGLPRDAQQSFHVHVHGLPHCAGVCGK